MTDTEHDSIAAPPETEPPTKPALTPAEAADRVAGERDPELSPQQLDAVAGGMAPSPPAGPVPIPYPNSRLDR
jgi:hypothetical protein